MRMGLEASEREWPTMFEYIWYRNSCKHCAAGCLERCYVLQGRMLLLVPSSSWALSSGTNLSRCLQQHRVLAFCRALAVGSQDLSVLREVAAGSLAGAETSNSLLLPRDGRRGNSLRGTDKQRSQCRCTWSPSIAALLSSALKALYADRWKWDVGSLNVLLSVGFHLG